MVLSDVLSSDEYEQELIASRLGCTTSFVSIQGKTKKYSVIIANGMPIEYRLFSMMILRFMGGYGGWGGFALEEDLARFWEDIEYRIPQAEKDAAKDAYWGEDNRCIIAMDNILACVNGERGLSARNAEMLPMMQHLIEQMENANAE